LSAGNRASVIHRVRQSIKRVWTAQAVLTTRACGHGGRGAKSSGAQGQCGGSGERSPSTQCFRTHRSGIAGARKSARGAYRNEGGWRPPDPGPKRPTAEVRHRARTAEDFDCAHVPILRSQARIVSRVPLLTFRAVTRGPVESRSLANFSSICGRASVLLETGRNRGPADHRRGRCRTPARRCGGLPGTRILDLSTDLLLLHH
jgi:hypothetical protein